MSNEELKRQLVKADLYSFATEVCGYTEVNLRTHGDVINALEAPTKRKMIVMPRGTFKSTISVIAYSVWVLINNPNARILIDSETYTNSKDFIREIKGIFKSQKFIDLFGDWEGSTWAEGELVVSTRTKNLKDPSIKAGGVEKTATGKHFDYILMDDLNSQKNSETPEMRAKIIKHYQMNTAILEPDGVMVLTATRYAVDDVVGWIMANEIGAQNET